MAVVASGQRMAKKPGGDRGEAGQGPPQRLAEAPAHGVEERPEAGADPSRPGVGGGDRQHRADRDDDLGLHVEEVGDAPEHGAQGGALAVVGAEAGGEVDADGQDGEVDGAGGDEHETDRLDRPPPVAGPAHGQGEAGQRRRRPAAERASRRATTAASWCRSACSGTPRRRRRRRRRGSDSASSRVDERRGASLTISTGVVDVDQQTAATALDDRRVQLADAGVEHTLERVGRHEIGDDGLDDRPGGDGELAPSSTAARARRRSARRRPRAPPAP